MMVSSSSSLMMISKARWRGLQKLREKQSLFSFAVHFTLSPSSDFILISYLFSLSKPVIASNISIFCFISILLASENSSFQLIFKNYEFVNASLRSIMVLLGPGFAPPTLRYTLGQCVLLYHMTDAFSNSVDTVTRCMLLAPPNHSSSRP